MEKTRDAADNQRRRHGDLFAVRRAQILANGRAADADLIGQLLCVDGAAQRAVAVHQISQPCAKHRAETVQIMFIAECGLNRTDTAHRCVVFLFFHGISSSKSLNFH